MTDIIVQHWPLFISSWIAVGLAATGAGYLLGRRDRIWYNRRK